MRRDALVELILVSTLLATGHNGACPPLPSPTFPLAQPPPLPPSSLSTTSWGATVRLQHLMGSSDSPYAHPSRFGMLLS